MVKAILICLAVVGAAFGVLALVLTLAAAPAHSAAAPPPPAFVGPVTTKPWYNSCFVTFSVPPGAADVRWVPLKPCGGLSATCKYAGLEQYGPNGNLAVPTIVPEIQVQGLVPGKAETGVLQAVSEVGPVPEYNLLDLSDTVLNPGGAPPQGVMPMYGSDEGPTSDGMTSTNGQGLWSNNPVVLAQSAPITVSALKGPLLPQPGAKQFWGTEFAALTTFSAPTDTAPAADNAWLGLRTIDAIQINHVAYTVLEQGLDEYPSHTDIFLMQRHLMWVAFDAGTYHSNDPLHQAHGYIGIQPQRTFTLTASTALRIEWSVDSENVDGRKAVEFLVQPAIDPTTNFSALDQGLNQSMDATNQIIAVRMGISQYQVTVGTGFGAAPTAGGPPTSEYASIDGAYGQAPINPWRDHGSNGKGRDDESDIVLWVSAQGVAVEEDGAVQCANGWDGSPPAWLTAPSGVRCEAASICYHLDNCVADEQRWQPANTYEYEPLAGMVSSDERHMNLLTAQVVPIAQVPAAVGN